VWLIVPITNQLSAGRVLGFAQAVWPTHDASVHLPIAVPTPFRATSQFAPRKKPDGSVDHRPTRTKCPTTAGTAGGDPSSASSEDPLPLPDGILPRRTTDRSRSGRGGRRAPRSGPDGTGETTVAGPAFWRPTRSSRARSLESTNHFDAARTGRISCRRRRCDGNTTADGRTVNDADNRRCKMAVCGSAPLLLARRCVYFEEAKPLRLYKS